MDIHIRSARRWRIKRGKQRKYKYDVIINLRKKRKCFI